MSRIFIKFAVGTAFFLFFACGSSTKNGSKDSGAVANGGSGGTANYADGGTGTDAGTAIKGKCGNGQVDKDIEEECDLGDENGKPGSGCSDLCEYSCHEDKDCAGDKCSGADATCDATTHACLPGKNMLPDGTVCGDNMACYQGVCTQIACGNGIAQPGEECDDGNPDERDGCTTKCKYTCVTGNKDYPPCANDCDPTSVCDDASDAGTAAHKCIPGKPLADNTLCANGAGYCVNGGCVIAECGDGTQDPNEECDKGEQNGVAGSECTAKCTTYECGNAVIEGKEQCDDGNTTNLDGCDSRCRVELVYRAVVMRPTKDPAPDFCVYSAKNFPDLASKGNAFGQMAVNTAALGMTNQTTDAYMNGAGMAFLFHILGVEDPTFKASDPSVEIGSSVGQPDNTYLDGGPLPDGSLFAQLSPAQRLDFPMQVWPTSYDNDLNPLTYSYAEVVVDGGTAVVQSTKPATTGFEIKARDGGIPDAGMMGMSMPDMKMIIRNVKVKLEVDPPRSKIPPPPESADWVTTAESSGGYDKVLAAAAMDAGASVDPTGVMCGAMDAQMFSSMPVPVPSLLGLPLDIISALCDANTHPVIGCVNGATDLAAGKCSSMLDLLTYGCKTTNLIVYAAAGAGFDGMIFAPIGPPDVDTDGDGVNESYSMAMTIAVQRVRMSQHGFAAGDAPSIPVVEEP